MTQYIQITHLCYNSFYHNRVINPDNPFLCNFKIFSRIHFTSVTHLNLNVPFAIITNLLTTKISHTHDVTYIYLKAQTNFTNN